MTLGDAPEWIQFPIDEAITLSGPGCAVSVRANEFAIRRDGRRLLALELTFVVVRASLLQASAAMRSSDPSLDVGSGGGSSDEVVATVRCEADVLASLPSNGAVLRRALGSGPLCRLGSWSLVSVRDLT